MFGFFLFIFSVKESKNVKSFWYTGLVFQLHRSSVELVNSWKATSKRNVEEQSIPG